MLSNSPEFPAGNGCIAAPGAAPDNVPEAKGAVAVGEVETLGGVEVLNEEVDPLGGRDSDADALGLSGVEVALEGALLAVIAPAGAVNVPAGVFGILPEFTAKAAGIDGDGGDAEEGDDGGEDGRRLHFEGWLLKKLCWCFAGMVG